MKTDNYIASYIASYIHIYSYWHSYSHVYVANFITYQFHEELHLPNHYKPYCDECLQW